MAQPVDQFSLPRHESQRSTPQYFKDLWRTQWHQILSFFGIQVVVAQFGLVLAYALALQADGPTRHVWSNALTSGSLYTYSVALLASGIAALACEIIERARDKDTLYLWQAKFIAIFLGSMVLMLQVGLMTPQLGSPVASVHKPTVDSAKATERGHTAGTSVTRLDSMNPLPPGDVAAPATVVPLTTSSLTASGHWMQWTLWLLSMTFGFILFLLARVQHLHDRYAKEQKEDVEKVIVRADNAQLTSFNEKLA